MSRPLFAAVFALLSTPFAARATGPFELGPGLRALPPLRHGPLAVFPVVRSDAQPAGSDDRYLTLRAGLERNEVAVEEVGRGGSVNQLRISNLGGRPLLILGGEIVLGGQQDRVLSRDTILAPGESAVVEVFCVEHGRWSGGRRFSAAGGMAEGGLRAQAKFGGSQGAVWDLVAKKNHALKAESSTGTYRNLAAGSEGRAATEPFRKSIGAELATRAKKDLVGVVAAVGGRVVSIDLFDSPALFAQYRDQLLDAIYLTAADAPASAGREAPNETEVRDFFSKARAAPGSEHRRNAATAVEHKARGVAGVELKAPAAAAPVYESYQAQ